MVHAPTAGRPHAGQPFREVPDDGRIGPVDAGPMKKTLSLVALALCAIAVAATPAGAAKQKYYFSITTTETYISIANCKSLPSGRTKETTTTTRLINQTGHVGGGVTTEGWEQTDLKRESWDNEALPPVELKGDKKPFGSK